MPLKEKDLEIALNVHGHYSFTNRYKTVKTNVAKALVDFSRQFFIRFKNGARLSYEC